VRGLAQAQAQVREPGQALVPEQVRAPGQVPERGLAQEPVPGQEPGLVREQVPVWVRGYLEIVPWALCRHCRRGHLRHRRSLSSQRSS
jgi:hypothetical protein